MQSPHFFSLAKPNGKHYFIDPEFGKEENSEQLMEIFGSVFISITLFNLFSI